MFRGIPKGLLPWVPGLLILATPGYVLLGWGGVAYDPDGEVAELLPQFVDVARQERTEEGTSHTIASPLRMRVLPFGDGWERGAGPGDFRTLDFGSVHNLKLTAGLVIELPLRERLP